MFSKLTALLALFNKGNEVADPEKWKKRQITATLLTPFLVALVAVAKAYGVDIPVTEEELAQVAIGLVVVINVLLTIFTSKKAGLGSVPPDSTTVDGF